MYEHHVSKWTLKELEIPLKMLLKINSFVSLVKLQFIVSACFSKELRVSKTKKSIKDQSNFCSNTFQTFQKRYILSTYEIKSLIMCPKNKFLKQLRCFVLRNWLVSHINNLITVHYTNIKKCLIKRNNKIYIWNELHSFVVVKYKHSTISGRSPNGGMKKIILFYS